MLSLLLLLSPCRLSAEATMTLRTSKLVSQYSESRRQASSRAQAIAKSALASSGEENTVGVMLSVTSSFDVKALEELGVAVGTHVNDVVTARATPAQLAQIAQLDGVLFVDADNRVRRKLDVAVPLIEADVVQQGMGNLPQAYTGAGVVVGVVDWGFDFTHPTFYDTLGNLRIVRVWNQDAKYSASGNDYGYGATYTQPDIDRLRCSSSSESHGTHVAGIAAGSGGTRKLYRGVAPDAELVLVQLHNGASSELIDGLSYIFSYAEEVGKPAVVNLSLGTHDGPHDGTSAFDRAVDGLTGKGRVVVGAAGNEGGDKLHASYTFSKSSGAVRTVVEVMLGKSTVTAWGSIGMQLDWTVELWDAGKYSRLQQATGNNLRSTQAGDKIDNIFIATAKDTVAVSSSSYNSDGNNKRGVINVDVKNTDPSKYAVVLVLKATSGTVHLWNLGNSDEGVEASFSALKNSSYAWMDGNTSYTIGEIGGTAKSVITVGSYNSKGTASNIGKISSYSSKGPTTDGRVKPDVIAPGSILVSAVNSCDFSYPDNSVVASEMKSGRRYYYAALQGTSMATPMVTGAVALLLQKRPTLTADSIRCILQQSAAVDAFIADLSENTRGAGKLSALSAVKNEVTATCKSLSVAYPLWSDSKQAIEFKIIPNPNSGAFRVETEEESALTVSVYGITGNLLYSSPVQAGGEVELSFLPSGIYVVQLSNGKKVGAKTMMVYR
jgi:subtilisin family serine protease